MREENKEGTGKYALILLRELDIQFNTKQEIAEVVGTNPQLIDIGGKGTDPVYAADILLMIERAENHPNKQYPD